VEWQGSITNSILCKTPRVLVAWNELGRPGQLAVVLVKKKAADVVLSRPNVAPSAPALQAQGLSVSVSPIVVGKYLTLLKVEAQRVGYAS
jgi:hypothetical protein